MSELFVVLKSGYHIFSLGYDNIDWFVAEVNKLENRIAFYGKNTNRDTILTEEDGKQYRNTNNCQFCEKKKYFLIRLDIIFS